MRADPWPWDVELNDLIGEIAAEAALREYGVAGLKESLSGVASAIRVSRKIRLRARVILAQRLNQDPINLAARNWLPYDWRGSDHHLHVLKLMQWGLEEGDLATPSYWETKDQVGGLIADMNDWNPAFVMAVINSPENPETLGDEVCIHADDLALAQSAASAAAILLELLETAANAGNLTTPNKVPRRRRSCHPGLTKTERQILGPLIKEVIRYNRDAWWQLKREIWDLGYQSYYFAQGDLFLTIERAVSRIPIDKRSSLCIEWGEANPRRDEISESNFIAAYTLMLLEEFVRRARVAAYRTTNWDNY